MFTIEQAAAAAETNAAKIAQQSNAATQLQCLQFLRAAKAEPGGTVGKTNNPSPPCAQNEMQAKTVKSGVWTRLKQAARSVKNEMFG